MLRGMVCFGGCAVKQEASRNPTLRASLDEPKGEQHKKQEHGAAPLLLEKGKARNLFYVHEAES